MDFVVYKNNLVLPVRNSFLFREILPVSKFLENSYLYLFSKTVHLLGYKAYAIYTDEELLLLLMKDDDKAFEFIYRTYIKELFRYARKNISIKEECEEIIHDIFLDIWKRRYQLRHVKSIKAYLITAVKFKIIRHIQHSKVKAKYAEHFKRFELLHDFHVIDRTESEPLIARLLDGMEGLPLRCQEALKLRLLESLSNDEIAQRMNISKKTVEGYMGRAFSHLRTIPTLISE